MAKLLKGNTDDLEEGINQILSLVKNPVGHLAKTFLTSSLEDIPHTVKPSPRPAYQKTSASTKRILSTTRRFGAD